ncbi:obscurin-like protein 1 isoform X3 [Xenopus tropicalis]|uniref:Obscurin-like protein 1 isoform X3 n=1 Tax=Xenopus tropicalis TaxID=8364 RepID=A0A8J1IYR2_XENTR|nr:obscurin-like protein 1 isoform X3 [Xenopus tropicalis]
MAALSLHPPNTHLALEMPGGAPRFLCFPRSITAPCGSQAVLRCRISGDPPPQVRWERAGNIRMELGDRCAVQNDGDWYQLVISDLRPEDTGHYMCRASNWSGEGYAGAKITVTPNLNPIAEPPANLPLQPHLPVISHDTPSLPTVSSDSCTKAQSLTHKRISETSTSQEADLNANILDLSQTELPPVTELPPHFLLTPVSQRLCRGQSGELTCKVSGVPEPTIRWEKDGRSLDELCDGSHYCLSPGGHTLSISRVHPPDAGVYVCRATNTAGQCLAAAVVLVDPTQRHGQEPYPGDPPAQVKVFTVNEGKHAKLRCLVTGKPRPEIIWRKDGRAVSPGRRTLIYEDREGHFILKVLFCRQQDRGLYVCGASNTAGNTLSAVMLHVREIGERFPAPLKDIAVREGQDAVLECSVPDGSRTSWYLEDQRLHPDKRHHMEEQGPIRRLIIRGARTDDDGVYMCQTQQGSQSIAEVAVRGPITKKLPRRLEVAEGGNAAFCAETESEMEQIGWTLNGHILSETQRMVVQSFGRTHVLVLVGVTQKDAGIVQFHAGLSESSCQLRVKARGVSIKPATGEAANRTLGAGQPLCLSCHVPGSAVRVRWMKDGQELESGGHFTIQSEGRVRRLLISSSHPSDSGTYTCHTADGSVSFTVSVNEPPVKIINTSDNTQHKCLAGEQVVLSCEVSRESAHVRWYRDGAELGEHEGLRLEADGRHRRLVIPSAKPQDSGEFVCDAGNDSVFYHVTVKEPPVKIVNTCDDTEHSCLSGGQVELSCEVSRESARVRWYKDGVEVEETEGIRLESDGRHRRLVICAAGTQDSGEFVCDTGDDSVFYNVTVTEPPVTIVNTSDDTEHSCLSGGQVELSCEVSRESARVRWYKDGVEVEETEGIRLESDGKHRRLVISNAHTRDCGEFVCDAGDDSVFYTLTVREPPVTITRIMEEAEQRWLSGEAVELSCEVSQDGGRVRWFRDNVELVESEKIQVQSDGKLRRLLITSAAPQDSGEYVCDSGDDSVAFNVLVAEPPVRILSDDPGEVRRLSGESVTLSCELSRESALVRWYKDGERLEESERVRMESEGALRRLLILSARVGDSGEFVCDAGDDSAFYSVTVTEPPAKLENTGGSAEQRCLSGGRVVLSCEVSREDAPVSWYKDGELLGEGENVILEAEGRHRRLIIPAARAQDSGEFVCDSGDDSLFYSITVTDPPVIIVNTSEDSDLKCLTGEQVLLSCEVSRESAHVAWYRDGVEVEESDRVRLEEDGTIRRLTILCAETHDSGEYVCDARDDSVFYYLSVTEPPVKFVNTSDDLELKCVTGEQVVLSCEVTRENARVRWYRDGMEVEEAEGIRVESDGRYRRLVIPNAQPQDSGEFVCDSGDDAVFYSVIIREPPTKILHPKIRTQDLQFITGERVQLVVDVSRSDGRVRWFKDGLEVDEDDNLQVMSEGLRRRLVLPCAVVEDSGEYICDTDSDSATFDVKVLEPPVKILPSGCSASVLNVMEGDPLSLHCELSRGSADLRWLKDGEELTPTQNIALEAAGTRHTLRFLSVQPEDAGQYHCNVGGDSRVFTVNVDENRVRILEREQMVPRRFCTVSEDLRLALSLSRADAEVRWYKDGERLRDAPHILVEERGAECSLTILGLERADAGEYLCDVSRDSFSFYVAVGDPPVTIVGNTGTPEQHLLMTGDDLVLTCELSRPNFKVRWLRNGEELVSAGRVKILARGVHRQLTIQNVRPGDSGTYTCDAGTDQMHTSVYVEAPRVVEFVTELQNITVLEGETASFKCMVSPDDVDLRWELNGSPVYSDKRFSTTSTGMCHSLTLRSCRLSDSGKVTANAEGLLSRAKLRVQEAQVLFTQGLQDMEAEEEQDLELRVQVTKDQAEIHWVKQGVVIQPSPKYTLQASGCTHSLTIHRLQASDRGRYCCESLHDRTECRLNVTPRSISIRKGLKDIKCEEGSGVDFTVELSHEGLVGEWWKGGVRVTNDNQCTIRASGRQHFLHLSDLTVPDSCVIAFIADSLRTTAQLTVTEPPLTITQPPQDFVVNEGGAATFQCEVSRQEATVTWDKDGVQLVPSARCRMYSVGRRRILQLSQCGPPDAGTYTCHMGDINAGATLRVLEQEPQMLKDLQDVDIVENENAVFTCEVSCAQAKGEWFKNGEPIRVTNTTKIRQEGRRHFLLICGAQCEDAGEITFRARRLQSTARLRIKEIPVRIVKSLRDRTALEGHRVVLECKVNPPRAQAKWLRGGREIFPSAKYQICNEDGFHKLIIADVAPEDEDMYTVSTAGGQSSARLLVEGLAVQVSRGLSDVRVTAPGDACFDCEVSLPLSRPPQWSLNGEPLHDGADVSIETRGKRHRLVLRDTHPRMSGTVRFTAGKARSEAKLTVQG